VIILAIETSCDETAISLVEGSGEFAAPSFRTLAHLVSSQVKLHAAWGGVVPMLAKREHARNIVPLLEQALKEGKLLKKTQRVVSAEERAQISEILTREPELLLQLLLFLASHDRPQIDAIAVTKGPGLEPALWVGINLARALSAFWHIPLVAVDHMEGHILSPLAEKSEIRFPALALLISGGHTELVLMKDWLQYEVLGRTRDDAVGEAFDKVARVLGLPYPGGPEIGRLAANAGPGELPAPLPRPMIHSGDLDFSFSGLKTAVLYLVQKNPEIDKALVAREFQNAVIEVLLAKTKRALEQNNIATLIIGGGVVANQELKNRFSEMIAQDFPHTTLLTPTHALSTDNATMIGIAGYFHALKQDFVTEIEAEGNLQL
jgi:N6-L-threonylcarbamoyladenine synthase